MMPVLLMMGDERVGELSAGSRSIQPLVQFSMGKSKFEPGTRPSISRAQMKPGGSGSQFGWSVGQVYVPVPITVNGSPLEIGDATTAAGLPATLTPSIGTHVPLFGFSMVGVQLWNMLHGLFTSFG